MRVTTGADETRTWEVRKRARVPWRPRAPSTQTRSGDSSGPRSSPTKTSLGPGSWEVAKSRGLLRVEGKDYLVKEGDILNIRFAA